MKNFKDFLKSKKTIVYHVSPDSSIGELRATGHHKGQQSVKMGESGIYVAPKFRDAVAWAISYVGSKKGNTQKPNERLKEKGGGYHGEKGPRNYKKLTIYEIEIPKDLLKNVWGSSFWEPEYFIPGNYMDSMKIIKSKTYSLDELMVLDRRRSGKRLEVMTKDLAEIKKASKNNIAARYYLELLDLYNEKLLMGKNPIINYNDKNSNDHVIRQEIDKLKNYIFYSDNNWTTLKVFEKLNKDQKNKSDEIYKEIKTKIQNL